MVISFISGEITGAAPDPERNHPDAHSQSVTQPPGGGLNQAYRFPRWLW